MALTPTKPLREQLSDHLGSLGRQDCPLTAGERGWNHCCLRVYNQDEVLRASSLSYAWTGLVLGHVACMMLVVDSKATGAVAKAIGVRVFLRL